MAVARVLVVDDDPALLQALPEALALRIGDLTVDTSDSASDALARIAETDYDAIVSDIKMPGMDGLALLGEIRRLRPSTPTLLMTGHGEHDLALQALRGGAYDFIQKPIERDYFIAALSRAVQVRQMSRKIANQQADLERHANELERTVEERTHELREANRIKDEFLATLSHELRTPLNSILGWIQLLRGGVLNKEAAIRAVTTIERNTKSLAQIIDDLLEVSRIITGKFKLEVRPMELGAIVEAALDAVRPAVDAKSIELHLSIEPIGLVMGDASRLQQVVWNLLSNAIKFTPNGGRVEVRLQELPSNARITVIDSGEGISADFLPYVFDRFRQADSTFTRRHGGLGLGLAIVRHLVEMHGGSVRADSQGEGKGASFTVTLPLLKARRGFAESYSQIPAGHPCAAEVTLAGLRVLIVDDEADARELLTAMLEQCGAQVTAVPSAADAIDCLRDRPGESMPDVLISDIGMPGLDGFELISRIRAMAPDSGGAIPAIALTAYARPEDRARVLEAGYQLHVPKPVEPARLSELVADLAGMTSKGSRRTGAAP
jgi:signal transduction histidine kinase